MDKAIKKLNLLIDLYTTLNKSNLVKQLQEIKKEIINNKNK